MAFYKVRNKYYILVSWQKMQSLGDNLCEMLRLIIWGKSN